MNQDELKGKMDQAKGKIKKGVGDATGNEQMQGEGAADDMKGKAREGFGRGKRKVGETIEDLGDDIKR